MKKNIVYMMLCLTFVSVFIAGCSVKKIFEKDKSIYTGAELPPNKITGDYKDKDAFVIWSWDDRLKEILDKCFAEDYPDIYNNIVYVNANSSIYYQDKLDEILNDPSNPLYPDMISLEIDCVQKYVQSGYLLSLKKLGMHGFQLAYQYDFYKEVCTNVSDGRQYASFWQATPGAWHLRADLCKKYLGTDDPEKLQEMFSTWKNVENTADRVNKMSGGKVKLLSGWDDLFRVFLNARTYGWYDEYDRVFIDRQIEDYYKEAKKFYDNDWTFGTVQCSKEWEENMSGNTDCVLAYTGSPWFINWKPMKEWEKNTILIKGPQYYFWGGSGLGVTKDCYNPEIAKTILEYFTCNRDSMKKIAHFSSNYMNNYRVNCALRYEKNSNVSKMYSQNYYEFYNNLMKYFNISANIVKPEDMVISQDAAKYANMYLMSGNLGKTLSDFKRGIHKRFNYLK